MHAASALRFMTEPGPSPASEEARATAAALPYRQLVDEIAAVLTDPAVVVPDRIVQPLPGGGSLFVMPAHDAHIAIVKLITYTPRNVGTERASIQGDIAVFDVATGRRLRLLDGPTVTARRTAAVTALAVQRLAARPDGPALIVGAGVQGRAHMEAVVDVVGTRRLWTCSRTAAAAQGLAAQARARGVDATAVIDARDVLSECAVVITCTPAREIVLRGPVAPDAFVAAIGAFTPKMIEIDTGLVQHFAQRGGIVLDTAHARHEAGDLLQAGVDVTACHILADCLRAPPPSIAARRDSMLFKSCGWAGWDLAAARCTVHA